MSKIDTTENSAILVWSQQDRFTTGNNDSSGWKCWTTSPGENWYRTDFDDSTGGNGFKVGQSVLLSGASSVNGMYPNGDAKFFYKFVVVVVALVVMVVVVLGATGGGATDILNNTQLEFKHHVMQNLLATVWNLFAFEQSHGESMTNRLNHYTILSHK
ncbi:hypothetical protein HELRODRAFT_172617 [Helobdella robusta]|uniref:Uncharacterized protein n=1 Tax=Helobdella robusta TaxID=6412 RepID=T1F5M9_HELRO|nr:hypothetical protein HELRODRAFT_172617 [Helobdella robusta]ESO04260.1 hypothetical protein HELRODRAFT_172617 [Helobdella robusta]